MYVDTKGLCVCIDCCPNCLLSLSNSSRSTKEGYFLPPSTKQSHFSRNVPIPKLPISLKAAVSNLAYLPFHREYILARGLLQFGCVILRRLRAIRNKVR